MRGKAFPGSGRARASTSRSRGLRAFGRQEISPRIVSPCATDDG